MQNGRVVLDEDISEADALVQVLKRLIEYIPPEFADWQDAVHHFQNQVPESRTAAVRGNSGMRTSVLIGTFLKRNAVTRAGITSALEDHSKLVSAVRVVQQGMHAHPIE